MLKSWLMLLITLFASSFITACQQDDIALEPVHVQVQTKIEKGATTSLTIFFKQKPDEDVLNFPQLKALERYAGAENIIKDLRASVVGGSEFQYAYYSYVRALEVGKMTFPSLAIHHNDQVYQSSPVEIEIVDKLTVQPDDFKLVLSASEKAIKVGDSISLQATLYSPFSNVEYAQSYMKDIQIAGEGNAIKIEKQIDVDLISGVAGLEKTIDDYFSVEDFDLDFDFQDRMVQINNKRYYKQLLLGLQLTAIKAGVVALEASCLKFNVYPSNNDYFGQFYTKEKLGQEISVCSEPLKITIVP